jgi:hypothetical protein
MKLTLFLVSAAIVAAQIVLMRAFSIAQWHHFAAMIISIALLGFGVSGTVLALWRDKILQKFRASFTISVTFFVISAPICASLAQKIPFTPFLVVWQPRQILYLLAIYLLLVVPFTLGALAIGLALARARDEQRVGAMYAVNLIGSGAGAILGLALCFLPLPVRISEYKGLKTALEMADARTLSTSHHPLGRVDLVESPALRVAPGLSLGYTGVVPRQKVLFVDADGASALVENPSEYLEWLPSAAPYALRNLACRQTGFEKVLVIGVGGGTELQQAIQFGVPPRGINGVEMHPRVAELVAGRVNVAEGRSFIRRTRERYDLIQISLLDALGASASGIGAANENYLYTVEALDDFLARLADDGILCITRWLKQPPRDNVRLFATAVEALERANVREPSRHLVFVRGWNTGTLLVKRSEFSAEEILRVRNWAGERLLDVDFFHGATERDVNLRNVMDEPTYFLAAQAILFGDREQFFRENLFNVRPATDNRPYFFHFFRWKTAPHLLQTMGKEWVPFVEWGYIVLIATLAQAAMASVLLIGLPIFLAKSRAGNWSVFAYFTSLGLGFMFLEMVMLQKFTLFLGNPLYSATVVIAAFLFFAGAGASQVGRRVQNARWPALAIAIFAVGYGIGLSAVLKIFLGAGDWARVFLTILLLAPLAFAMGMMFPLGLSRISPQFLPWAWGVNGCFSVIGVVLASVLAMDFGFTAVIFLATALYLCAGATFRRLS